MFVLRPFMIAFLPVLMAMQTGKPPAKSSAAPKSSGVPVFTKILDSSLGDRWYSVFLFDKKNITALNEKTERGKYNGRDVYFMNDTDDTNMGGDKSNSRVSAVVDVDFSLIRLEYENNEDSHTKKLKKKERAFCEAVRKGVVGCDFWEEGGATETITFDNGGEPIYYDGAIDRLEMEIGWKRDTRLDVSFISVNDKKLKRMVVTCVGMEKKNIGGREVEAAKLRHIVTGENIEIMVNIAPAVKELVDFTWGDGDLEVRGYPAANEKKAREEKMKFAAQIPAEKRTPLQAAVILLSYMAEGDNENIFASFDLRMMYGAMKEQFGEEAAPDFDEWKDLFVKAMQSHENQAGGDGAPGEYTAEMAMALESMGERAFDINIEGDSATVVFKPTGEPILTLRMRRGDGGWKIFWIDDINGPGGDGGEEE